MKQDSVKTRCVVARLVGHKKDSVGCSILGNLFSMLIQSWGQTFNPNLNVNQNSGPVTHTGEKRRAASTVCNLSDKWTVKSYNTNTCIASPLRDTFWTFAGCTALYSFYYCLILVFKDFFGVLFSVVNFCTIAAFPSGRSVIGCLVSYLNEKTDVITYRQR